MVHTDQRPTIILLSGYARAGKNTFALGMQDVCDNLIETSIAFSLKEACDEMVYGLNLNYKRENTFFNEEFKAKHRDFLVATGRFARSLNKDVFVNELINRVAYAKTCNVVVTDWRYLNEVNCIREKLTEWRIVTVYIETLGLFAINEEEALSIAEIRRAMACDYEFYFAPNSASAVISTGRNLARELGLG